MGAALQGKSHFEQYGGNQARYAWGACAIIQLI